MAHPESFSGWHALSLRRAWEVRRSLSTYTPRPSQGLWACHPLASGHAKKRPVVGFRASAGLRSLKAELQREVQTGRGIHSNWLAQHVRLELPSIRGRCHACLTMKDVAENWPVDNLARSYEPAKFHGAIGYIGILSFGVADSCQFLHWYADGSMPALTISSNSGDQIKRYMTDRLVEATMTHTGRKRTDPPCICVRPRRDIRYNRNPHSSRRMGGQ